MCDPIMNDPEANAISFSHLSHAEAPGRRFVRRNTVLVSDPSDGADREWLPCRTAMAFSAQQGDNVTIRVIDRQLSNARDKGLRIPNRLSPVLWQPE